MLARAIPVVAVLLVAGCTVEVTAKPDQVPQFCEALDGSDRFVIDPYHEATSFIRGYGTPSHVKFEDRLTGFKRVVDTTMFVDYRCRDHLSNLEGSNP